jgi:hypothetical protein
MNDRELERRAKRRLERVSLMSWVLLVMLGG